jgi:hypothetical protein
MIATVEGREATYGKVPLDEVLISADPQVMVDLEPRPAWANEGR